MPILWDIGGVHVHFGEQQTGRRRWQQRLGRTELEFDQILWTAIGSDGRAGTSAIVDRLVDAFDDELTAPDAHQLLHDANDHWHPDAELNDFAIRLHDEGTPSIVVANAGPAARWAFEAIIGIDRFADDLVLSAEVGVDKPDPQIYRLALARLGDPDPADCLFVDDLPENVAGAEALGIAAIRHTSNATTIEAVTRWLDRTRLPRHA
jgi:putative hydrolase of the HAD superfamily